MSEQLNQESSPEQRRRTASVVFENLAEFFFEKVVFLNLLFSDLGGGGTTSQTIFGKDSRIIDTSGGFLMRPGRTSRFRGSIYLRNPNNMEGYILSPAVFDSFSFPASFTSMDILRAYAGIKILNGQLFAVTKQAGGSEEVFPIDYDITMFDSEYSDTFFLEIKHYVQFTEIFINNQFMGSFSSNMVGTFNEIKTFYSFFSPARSTSGARANIVCEYLQFIQEK